MTPGAIVKGDLEFRECSEADFAIVEKQVLALYESLDADEPAETKINVDKIQKTFAEFSQRPEKGKIIVFERVAAIVGYALLVFYWSNEYGGNVVFVDELYVEAAERSRGIGAAFFIWLEDQLRGKAVAIALEVHPANQRAALLYERLGFLPYPNLPYFKELA